MRRGKNVGSRVRKAEVITDYSRTLCPFFFIYSPAILGACVCQKIFLPRLDFATLPETSRSRFLVENFGDRNCCVFGKYRDLSLFKLKREVLLIILNLISKCLSATWKLIPTWYEVKHSNKCLLMKLSRRTRYK